MGTWSRIGDGGDLEAVVRGSTVVRSTPWDSNNRLPCKFMLTSYECCMESLEDSGVVHNGISATAESAQFKRTQALKNDEGCAKIMPFPMANVKQEPENIMSSIESVVTVNSPRICVKSRSLSPASFDNSAQKEAEERSSSTLKTHSNAHSLTKIHGAKKRKHQERRIVCVPMEEGSWNKQGGAGVASDLWSWRKYGQKPIKGSPYPRGYYRCSSSKGCPARKQLERSRTDPTMLVITYTADHNHAWPAHRNALARSSRQKSNHDNKMQPLSVSHSPDAPPTEDNDEAVMPLSDKLGPNLNSFDGEDQHVGIDELSAIHMLEDNLFADLWELPELYPEDFMKHSGEEAVGTVVDPFNLFDWSFSINEMPNS